MKRDQVRLSELHLSDGSGSYTLIRLTECVSGRIALERKIFPPNSVSEARAEAFEVARTLKMEVVE